MSATSMESIKFEVNVTLERYKLYQMHQKPGQRFEDFLSDVTDQVDRCEFGSMWDEILLYKIVGGIYDDEIRNELLEDADLTYDKAIQICRSSSVVRLICPPKKVRQVIAVKKEGDVGNTPNTSCKEPRRPLDRTKCYRKVVSERTGRRPWKRQMTSEDEEEHHERHKNTCEQCGKDFSSKAALKTHEVRHTGEKPFACNLCGFRTASRGNLSSHMRSHSEEKPYVCSVCGYSCKQKCGLRQHMMTHTDEKPYACKVCDRRFSQTAHVKRHMLIHTGDKPYVCEICGHCWTTQSNLKQHMRVHEKYSSGTSQPTRSRKRHKKPLVIVVAEPSDESGQSERAAADAIITWSEHVSTMNSIEYRCQDFEDPTSYPSDISGSPEEPEAPRRGRH